MNAPDKIYLNIPKDNPVIYNNDVLEIATWSTKEFADCKNICYIRKDYLLKWAKDELKLSKDVECVSEKSYEEGRQQVALNLIDKLNEI